MNISQRTNRPPICGFFHSRSDGITLLEVVLALSILAGAFAVLSQHVSTGIRAAKEAKGLTRAQLFAESLMSEMVAGVYPPGTMQGTIPEDPTWSFASIIEVADQPGMVRLVVIVERQSLTGRGPNYQLVRMIRDPSLPLPDEEETETTDDGESSDASSSSSSTSSSSSSSSSNSAGSSSSIPGGSR